LRQLGKKTKFQSAGCDLPRVRRDRQSVIAACEGRLPDIVVPLPQCRQAISSFSEPRRCLLFVHISAVERAGLSTLNENQVVEYDLVENRGKSSAENLKVS
jgi:hypothetical protein